MGETTDHARLTGKFGSARGMIILGKDLCLLFASATQSSLSSREGEGGSTRLH